MTPLTHLAAQLLAIFFCIGVGYLQEVAAYTKDAISESIMPVGLTDEKVGAFDVTKPFTYQIEFDLPPKLTWRRPYKGLKVRPAAIYPRAVHAALPC